MYYDRPQNLCDIRFLQPVFTLEQGKLYRILANGSFKRIELTGASPAVRYQGQRYLATELAWALHYGAWPAFNLFVVDGDPRNLNISNLLPIRGVRSRARIRNSGRFWRQPLEPHASYNSEAEAMAAWRADYAAQLRPHLGIVLKEQDELIRAFRRDHPDAFKPGQPPKRQCLSRRGNPVPRFKPTVPPNMRVYWDRDDWVVVPAPVHVSDDYRCRIDAVRWLGAERFEYDETLDMTVAVLPDGSAVSPADLPSKVQIARQAAAQR